VFLISEYRHQRHDTEESVGPKEDVCSYQNQYLEALELVRKVQATKQYEDRHSSMDPQEVFCGAGFSLKVHSF
jgi:hypothetical protein